MKNILLLGILLAYYDSMNKNNEKNELDKCNDLSHKLVLSYAAAFAAGSYIGETKAGSFVSRLYSENPYIFICAVIFAIGSLVLPIGASLVNISNTKIPGDIKGNDVKTEKFLLKKKNKLNTLSFSSFLFSLLIIAILAMKIYL